MSRDHPQTTASSSSNFQQIFNDVLNAYALAPQLQACDFPGAILSVLQKQVEELNGPERSITGGQSGLMPPSMSSFPSQRRSGRVSDSRAYPKFSGSDTHWQGPSRAAAEKKSRQTLKEANPSHGSPSALIKASGLISITTLTAPSLRQPERSAQQAPPRALLAPCRVRDAQLPATP